MSLVAVIATVSMVARGSATSAAASQVERLAISDRTAMNAAVAKAFRTVPMTPDSMCFSLAPFDVFGRVAGSWREGQPAPEGVCCADFPPSGRRRSAKPAKIAISATLNDQGLSMPQHVTLRKSATAPQLKRSIEL